MPRAHLEKLEKVAAKFSYCFCLNNFIFNILVCSDVNSPINRCAILLEIQNLGSHKAWGSTVCPCFLQVQHILKSTKEEILNTDLFTFLHMPKSVSLACPFFVSITLSGLISRWRIPFKEGMHPCKVEDLFCKKPFREGTQARAPARSCRRQHETL